MKPLRIASDAPIPYRSRQVVLLLVGAEGGVAYARDLGDKRALLNSAADGLVVACWPGQWGQDAFRVDDVPAAIEALS